MVKRAATSELLLVCMIALAGLALRSATPQNMEVEHFDEGVYASVLWYDELVGARYPARDLYAPPLLSALIEFFAAFPGCRRLAPFLPSILAGALTPLVLWKLTRDWFGFAAGLFVAVIAALSDFHVLYSRMALTDVPALFFVCAATGLGVSGIHNRSFRRMMFAGVVCGLAWWTKYTGWLPLAILCSGSGLWWIWKGRHQLSLPRLIALNATAGATAFAVWSPWLLVLQESGGYAAVAANHAGYLGDLSTWSSRLALQLTYQFRFDGFTGCVSVGLGMLIAGTCRWTRSRRSTGNDGSQQHNAHLGSFPPFRTLARFVVAALGLTVIAFSIWTPLLLSCLAVGGIAGVVLWPVLQRLYARKLTGDLSPTAPGARPLSTGDLECAPTVDPALAISTVVTWFAGMLVATPMYHPYSRLFLPLSAVLWIAAAAAAGWWIESNLSVARHFNSDVRLRGANLFAGRLVAILLTAAVLLSLRHLQNPLQSLIFQDRTDLRSAAIDVAKICEHDARGEPRPKTREIPANATIYPDGRESRDSNAAMPPSAPNDASTPNSSDSTDRDQSELATSDTKMVVYAYGEPALLFHLNSVGVVARPVGHLNLSRRAPSDAADSGIASFLVIGPYAKRTPGFWEEWLPRASQFEFVDEVFFRPSEVVLLDLCSPTWLRNNNDAAEQRLEIYRIR